MPRNSYSPTYSPYADAAMVASRGINITFDDIPTASRFQRGFSSWVARQMGYEGLSTQRTHSTVRVLNTFAVHQSAVVTDAGTGAPITLGQDHDPTLCDWSLDDLDQIQQIPEEGLDLE